MSPYQMAYNMLLGSTKMLEKKTKAQKLPKDDFKDDGCYGNRHLKKLDLYRPIDRPQRCRSPPHFNAPVHRHHHPLTYTYQPT